MKKSDKIKLLEEEIEKLKQENEKLKQENELLRRAAYKDSLTNINNRRILDNYKEYNYLVLGDLDDFKEVNDKHGHIIGDAVLVAVSKVLKSGIKSDDIVCRWGGEEFVLLLNNTDIASSLDKVTLIKDSIESLEKAFDFKITMSFGLTEIDKDKSIDEIINEADEAMYQSKLNGKNMISVYKSKVK